MRALIALCCCIALSTQAETFSAKVIAVMDGDTVMVLRDGQKIKVRLANIDAPERDQPFGQQSRDSLLEMVGKRQVQVDSQAVDQYGRVVGLISVDGRNINQEQVQRGMAWEYSHYHSDKTYIDLQHAARQAHRGLWAQSSQQAPWQWRKLHPSVKPIPQINQHAAFGRAAPVMLYDMECGKKHRCSQMVSCDEAYFYFTLCGVETLDRNKDGAPCENLCGGKKQ
jgi:endonuclease YncB( thermonuclease family)